MADATLAPAAAESAADRSANIGRQTLVYGVGIVLSKVLSFVMLPFYTNYLTPRDYGVLQLIDLTLEVASIVAGARLAVGVFRFYHKATDELARQRVCATAFALLSVGYAMMALVIALARGPITHAVLGGPSLQTALLIGTVSFVVQGLSIVPLSVLRLRDAAVGFTVATLGKGFLQALLNILFLRAGWGVQGALLANLISAAVVAVGLLAWFWRWAGLRFDTQVARDLIRFGAPLVVGQVASFLLTFGDRYFLRAYATEDDVGLYALAYQFGFLMLSLAYQPFAQVWESERFAVAKRPDRDEVFARNFVLLNISILGAAAGFAMFAPVVLRIMSDPAFWSAGAMVAPILAAYVFHGWSSLLDVGILLKEETRRLAHANYLSGAVCIGLYFWLIPPYRGMGAAVATLIAFILRFGLVYHWAQQLEPIGYRWGPVLRLAACALTAALIERLLPILGPWPDVAIRGVILSVIYLVGWRWALEPEHRAAVRVQVERFTARFRSVLQAA